MQAIFVVLLVVRVETTPLGSHGGPCKMEIGPAQQLGQTIADNFVKIALLRAEVRNLHADLVGLQALRHTASHRSTSTSGDTRSEYEAAMEHTRDFYGNGAVSTRAQNENMEYNPLPWSTRPVNADESVKNPTRFSHRMNTPTVETEAIEGTDVENADTGRRWTHDEVIGYVDVEIDAGGEITDMFDRILHKVSDIGVMTITLYNVVFVSLTLTIVYRMIKWASGAAHSAAQVNDNNADTDIEKN